MTLKKYDLHMHSLYSWDSSNDPKKLVEQAKRKGLNGIAVTDHNTIKGGLAAKKYSSPDFEVIVGSEILTNKGEIIGLYLKEEIKSKDFYQAVKEIRKQGGLIIVPHPCDRLRRHVLKYSKEDLSLIDALEVFNSRTFFPEDNDKALKLAKKMNLPIVAGSDSHLINEVGGAYNIFEGDLRKAILNKKIKVSGRRTPTLNHVITKLIKYKTKLKRKFIKG